MMCLARSGLAVGADPFYHVVDGEGGEAVGEGYLRGVYCGKAVDTVAALAVEVCMQVAVICRMVTVMTMVAAACLEACETSPVLYGVYESVRLQQVEHTRYAGLIERLQLFFKLGKA